MTETAKPSHRCRRDTELTRVAFHEAGHAAVAVWLGLTVTRVFVVSGPSGIRGEHLYYVPLLLAQPTHPGHADAVRARLAVLVAGPLAEEHLLGFAPMQPPWRCRADYVEAANMAARLAATGLDAEQARSLIPAAESRVRRLWKEPGRWDAVTRVATALMQDQSVDGSTPRYLLSAGMAA